VFIGLKVPCLEAIYIIGGSSRIPRLREMIQSAQPDVPISKYLSPEEAVVKGCALFAARIVQIQDGSSFEHHCTGNSTSVSSTGSKQGRKLRRDLISATIIEEYVNQRWQGFEQLKAELKERTNLSGECC